MKIICCKCKKEYSMGDNIFRYNKANRPILICPYCKFKHIIDFMPFEKGIKVERIRKLDLGGGPYFVSLGASRIANAQRVDQSGSDDGNVTNWDKTHDFILATRIYGSKGSYLRAYKLRWKVSSGTFADVGATGAITYNADTDLSSTGIVTLGERICNEQSGYAWQNGCENEGDNLLPNTGVHVLPDEYYSEFQWALDCNNAVNGTTYEFELWDITEGASIGTCLATITMSSFKNTSGIANINTNLVVAMKTIPAYVTGKANISTSIISMLSRIGLGWDITDASYENKNIDVGIKTTCPYAIFFNPDGSKMYLLGSNGTIFQYTLSTPWDVDTAIFADKQKDVTDEEATPVCFYMKSNGQRMYILGYTDEIVYEYALTTAWDISTATYYSGYHKDISGDIGTTAVKGIFFSTDGNKMYVVGWNTKRIYQYTLSTPWSVDTASYDNKSFYIGDQVGYPMSLHFNPDGNKFYTLNWTKPAYQYSLSTPWDIESASYNDKNYSPEEDGHPLCIFFRPNGLKMYISGNDNDSIHQYTLEAQVENATGKASISTSIISILSRGKVEGATAKAGISSSMTTLLKRGLKNATGKASLTSILSAVLSRGKIENATGEANITTNIISILSRGKIENATAKADMGSLIIALLKKEAKNATGKASINTSIDITLARGKIENATGSADISSSIISILSRGQIEAVTGKTSITSNFGSILSRGKIENVSGKANIISSFMTIIKGIYAAKGEASITSIITSILLRGKIENASGKADVETSVTTILSRGRIEDATGKADIISNITAVLSRGQIEEVTGKASINTIVSTVLSRGKIEGASGIANMISNFIAILQTEAGINATGKASISSVIDITLLRGKIENATGKASITSDVDVILSRGQIENTSGKANINTAITIILSRGKIENTTGKADITSDINILLSRGKIENVNGKAFIYTTINANILSSKRATGKASINSFIDISLKKFKNASGKSIFDTLIEIEVIREYAFSQATLGIVRNQTELSIEETDTEIDIKRTETKLGIER